ncbi:LysR family transcriptional regulator [Sanyastnella coralliicola]|uniref:LysR family transcriptional regulator n=1 Tax=Sanyastnella coralliicola TaxID=3069118 RepID=UPI0027B90D74|nr:LysR family transcriptional regulator [Longitalea sp. SCSIO 12813]
MNYTLHQLRIFLKIVEHRSITRASEDLHLTQPAVSIQLKRLQDQFEIPLTEVIGRQLYITDFGQEIAEVSKKILKEADGIKATVNSYKGILTGEIKISIVSTGKYVIPYFLQGFMKKYPGVEISIDVSNKNQVIENLNNNRSDFYLVSVLPEDTPVEAVELMENRLIMVGSSKYADMKLTKSKLNDLTLIYREEGSATRNAMEDYLAKKKISPSKSMELVSNEAVKQAVNAGIGFSIMPLIGLRNELSLKSMHVFPMQGLPIITTWNLIYNKSKRLTPADEALISYLEENKEAITKEYFSWSN